jgi:hypothetical protein
MTAFVVLPPVPDDLHRHLAGVTEAVHVIDPAPGPDHALAARVCAGISRSEPSSPLVILAAGRGALLLPAVARAQHSAHRRVVAYLLLEPELPPVSDTWPDAPVAVVSDDEWVTTQVRLRGWDLCGPDRVQDWLRDVSTPSG